MIRREDPKGETVTFNHTMAGTITARDDVKGNQTSRPATRLSPALNLEWNFDNQMIGADTNGSAGSLEVTFENDALGRRVSRSHSSGNVVYVHAGQQVIADHSRGTAASTPTYRSVYADYVDEPILRHAGTAGSTLPGSGDEALFYHRNQQYSIVALTNAAGTLVERYTYTAYGTLGIHAANGTVRTTSTYNNRYTYTGREYDPDLKLYHFRARWYDPATGGFISRDPLGYVDGMSLYRGYFGVDGLDYFGLSRIVFHSNEDANVEFCRSLLSSAVFTKGILHQFPCAAALLRHFLGASGGNNICPKECVDELSGHDWSSIFYSRVLASSRCGFEGAFQSHDLKGSVKIGGDVNKDLFYAFHWLSFRTMEYACSWSCKNENSSNCCCNCDAECGFASLRVIDAYDFCSSVPDQRPIDVLNDPKTTTLWKCGCLLEKKEIGRTFSVSCIIPHHAGIRFSYKNCSGNFGPIIDV